MDGTEMMLTTTAAEDFVRQPLYRDLVVSLSRVLEIGHSLKAPSEWRLCNACIARLPMSVERAKAATLPLYMRIDIIEVPKMCCEMCQAKALDFAEFQRKMGE